MKTKISLFLFVLSAILFVSNSSNPPNGKTGAPGENTCTQCHAGPNPNFAGSLQILGIPEDVIGGNTYTLSVLTTDDNLNAVRAGFQMTVLDENNNAAGTFTNASSGSTITESGGRIYHEHNPAQNFSGGTATWLVDWTVPTSGVSDGSDLTFYAASVIGNGSGTSNDLVVTDQEITNYTAPAEPLTIEINNSTDPLCFDGNDGTAFVDVTNNMGDVIFLWSNGETVNPAVMLPSGVSTVIVTDTDGSSAMTEIELENPSQITNGFDFIIPSCNGDSNGAIFANGMGGANIGSNTYGYMWSNGETTQDIMNLSAGAYSVTITDDNNCFEIFETTLDDPDPITINATVNNVSCQGSSNGSILTNAFGGQTELSYAWNTGDITNSLENIPAGTYSVTVSDLFNCFSTAEYIVTEPNSNFTVSIIETESIPCFNFFGSISATTEEMNIVSYEWSNNVDSQENNGVVSGLYSVTVTNSNGCTATTSYTLEQPTPLTLDVDVTNPILADNGRISVTPTGGIPPYSYQWTTGSTDSLITDLGPGNYGVVVTDANNCQSVQNINLSSECMLEGEVVEITTIQCPDEAFQVGVNITGANGPINYSWSNNDTLETTYLLAGSHSVIITDSLGCSDTIAFDLEDTIAMILSFNITPIEQNQDYTGSIEVIVENGVAPYSYVWSTGDTLSLIDSLSVGGEYIVTITDSNGCIISDTINLTTNPCQLEGIVNIIQPECSGDLGEVLITFENNVGPVKFEPGDIIADSVNLMDLSEDTYNYFIRDTIGCLETLTFQIVADTFNLDLISIDTTSCSDSLASIEILASGENAPYDILWSTGDTTIILDSIETGTYSVTVTASNGCTLEDSYEVIMQLDERIIDINDDDAIVYVDDEGNFNGSLDLPSITNSLQGSCMDSLYLQMDSIFTDCAKINDTLVREVFVYNYDEIIEVQSITILVLDTIPPDPIICPIVEDIEMCGPGTILLNLDLSNIEVNDNCGARISPTTATIFIEYQEDTTTTINQLVTAIDSSGNTSTCIVSFDVISYPQLIVEPMVTDVGCFGESTGCIDLNISGGTPPYETTEPYCDTVAGEYTVYVTDANGCDYLEDITINEPALLEIDVVENGPENPGESDGFINVDVQGGTPDYNYEWTENGVVVSNLEDLINYPSSQYKLKVTDANGCMTDITSFIDVVDAVLDAEFSQINIFPNPFSSNLVVEGLESHMKVQVTNILGEIIETNNITNDSNVQIETEHWINGIYLVHIISNEKMATFRMVRTK